MSFDWGGYLELAGELGEAAPEDALTPARWRSAISRAYYAAFHHAQGYLGATRSEAAGRPGQSVHQAVARALKSGEEEIEQRAGDKLWELRGYRNAADYDGDAGVDAVQVAVSLVLAAEVIADLTGS